MEWHWNACVPLLKQNNYVLHTKKSDFLEQTFQKVCGMSNNMMSLFYRHYPVCVEQGRKTMDSIVSGFVPSSVVCSSAFTARHCHHRGGGIKCIKSLLLFIAWNTSSTDRTSHLLCPVFVILFFAQHPTTGWVRDGFIVILLTCIFYVFIAWYLILIHRVSSTLLLSLLPKTNSGKSTGAKLIIWRWQI